MAFPRRGPCDRSLNMRVPQETIAQLDALIARATPLGDTRVLIVRSLIYRECLRLGISLPFGPEPRSVGAPPRRPKEVRR